MIEFLFKSNRASRRANCRFVGVPVQNGRAIYKMNLRGVDKHHHPLQMLIIVAVVQTITIILLLTFVPCFPVPLRLHVHYQGMFRIVQKYWNTLSVVLEIQHTFFTGSSSRKDDMKDHFLIFLYFLNVLCSKRARAGSMCSRKIRNQTEILKCVEHHETTSMRCDFRLNSRF